MDAAFHLDEGSRANFLRLIMQSFGCFYICLWSYMPHPSNCLFFLDGIYDEENHPSSSSGSLARRLFDEYRLSIFNVVENECVPGFAFRNSLPYVELQEMDLQRQASSENQRQFYQEARIKTAVFMGCKGGEVELGLSNVSQLNIKREMMRTWLPEAFSRQLSPHTEGPSRPISDQQNPVSSSSSSLRSLSTMDSPEYSSLLFNIATSITSSHNIPEVFTQLPVSSSLQPINIAPLEPIPTMNIITTTTTSPHQQALQQFSLMRNIQFPAPEIEDAAMTRAILAVLSSSHQPPGAPPQAGRPSSSTTTHLLTPKTSAFKTFNSSALAPRTQMSPNLRRQTMHKRSISFLRSLNLMRIRESIQASRPTTSQLHHMISERKRREKLNESFHTLKSLLPPGTKKDKASVLTTAREYLASLKAQVAELSKRNQQLEARLLPPTRLGTNEEEATAGSSSERSTVSVNLTRIISESTPDEQDQQIIDLQVVVRSVESCTEDMVIRILEFLKRVRDISLMSMEANTRLSESNSNINRVILRLRVDQGPEWDEAAFQEAVRRVVADLVLK